MTGFFPDLPRHDLRRPLGLHPRCADLGFSHTSHQLSAGSAPRQEQKKNVLSASHWPAIFAALLLLCSLSAHAQLVFSVNSILDEVDVNLQDFICQTAAGTCTLRAATMTATRYPGTVTIVLPAGRYVLTLALASGSDDSWGDLDLDSSPPVQGFNPFIAIQGAGASVTTIDANRIDRVLEVAPGSASISDVTITGGLRASSIGGAGIYNAGSLTLTRVVVTNNEYLTGTGGGILNSSVLSVFDSTIIGNRADLGAGVRSPFITTITIDRSTIAGNIARRGGGLSLDGANTIRNSLIANNSAREDGGGISYADSSLRHLINTTISGNTASQGAGIYLDRGTVNVYNTSVIGNNAVARGGGIFVTAGATFGVRNSLLSGNIAFGDFNDCLGAVVNNGATMLSTLASCSSSGVALSLVNRSTIGALQDNGGPTRTHALLAGSQAIDGTVSSACVDQNSLLTTDQRGAPRVFGVRCDVGAYEFGSVVDLLFANGFQ